MTTLEKLERKGYDNLQTCPYNSTHQVIASRMQFHITKCRQNYKTSEYVKCPFNVIHHIPKLELALHVQECEDRIHFERYKNCIDPDSANHIKAEGQENEKPQEVVHYGMDDGGETWDDEKVEAYKPAEYVKDKIIYRKTQGFNRKQKMKFRQEEAERLKMLKEKLRNEMRDEEEDQDRRRRQRIKKESQSNTTNKIKEESFSSVTNSSSDDSDQHEEAPIKNEPEEDERMSVKNETESEKSDGEDQMEEDGDCSDLEDGEIKEGQKKKRRQKETPKVKEEIEQRQQNIPKKIKLENGNELKEEGECSSSDED